MEYETRGTELVQKYFVCPWLQRELDSKRGIYWKKFAVQLLSNQSRYFRPNQALSAPSIIVKSFLLLFTRLLAHVDDAADAVTSLHVSEGGVDLVERLSVGDEFIDLQLAGHVVVNEVGKLGAALDTTESASLPDTTSNKLES